MAGNAQQELKKYIPIAEFMSKCYGEDVEVVLHDISDLDHSAVAIYNNHVSGREMGAPMTAFGLKIIRDKLYKDQDFVVDKNNVLDNGKVLRSATYYIKDDGGALIGTLCVNIDVSRFVELSRMLQRLAFGDLPDEHQTPRQEPAKGRKEAFPATVDELIDGTILEYVGEKGSIDDLTAERKTELVGQLNDKGIFMFKGTVKKVSQALGVSEPTVYRYLNSANNNNGKTD